MAKPKRKTRKELEAEISELKDKLIKALSQVHNVNLPTPDWCPKGLFDSGIRYC